MRAVQKSMSEPAGAHSPLRLLILLRRQRRQREGVQARREFVLERGVDEPMARDTALAVEDRGHDLDAEMSLPALAPTGMSMMARRLVLHGKTRRRKLGSKLVVNRCCDLPHHSPLLPGQLLEHILAKCLDGA